MRMQEFGVAQLLLMPWQRDPQLATHEVVAASTPSKIAHLQLYSEYAFLYLLSPHLDPIAETRLEYPSTPLNISMDIGKYIYVGINDTVYAFSDDLTQVSRATYPGNVLRVRPINGVVHVVYESSSGSVLEMDTPELRRESTHAFTYKILDMDAYGSGFIAIERLNKLLFLDNEFNITNQINIIKLVDKRHSMITPLHMDIVSTLTQQLEVNTVHVRGLGDEFVVGSTRGYLLMRGTELIKVLETYVPPNYSPFKIMDVNRDFTILTHDADNVTAVIKVDTASFINLDAIIMAVMNLTMVEKELANVEEI